MGTLERKLQRTKQDQFTVTIPKALITLLNWKEQDVLEFGFYKGRITLAKKKGRS